MDKECGFMELARDLGAKRIWTIDCQENVID